MKKVFTHCALILLCLLLFIVMPYLLFKSSLPTNCTTSSVQCQHITSSKLTAFATNR